MTKNFLREFYYFFYDILISIRNLNKDKNFIIIFPRIISRVFKIVLIYDKLNKKIFFQKIRNKFDLLTVFEIFAHECYTLNNLEKWDFINRQYLNIISKNKKPLLIDCGSNIGSSCEYFSRIFKDIYSILIEPNQKSSNFSKKNIYNKNYNILNFALSSESKIVNFDDSIEDNRASKINNVDGKKIKTITINEILENYKDYEPFIIKIDIEGYEEDLFKNNYDWINNFEVLIIEIHDWMMPSKSISFNFFRAICEIMNKYEKRDIIISGENLLLIKNYDK